MEAFRVFFTPNRKNGAAVEFNVSVARTATVLELLMKSLPFLYGMLMFFRNFVHVLRKLKAIWRFAECVDKFAKIFGNFRNRPSRFLEPLGTRPGRRPPPVLTPMPPGPLHVYMYT